MVVKGIPVVPPYRVVRLYGDTVVQSTGSTAAIQRRPPRWAWFSKRRAQSGAPTIRNSNLRIHEKGSILVFVTVTLTPALTIVVGAIIGLIAVTLYSSIYSMVDVLPE